MRIGVLLKLDHLDHLLSQNVDVLVIAPGSDFDEFDVKEITEIRCVNLNDYLAKGEISSLSTRCASFIRALLAGVDGPAEAISSQNDLYQYHLRMQFLFLTALERFLAEHRDFVLVFGVSNLHRYYSPMRPDLGVLFDPLRTLAYLASQLASKLNAVSEFRKRKFMLCKFDLIDRINLQIRSWLMSLFMAGKLLEKIVKARVKNSPDISSLSSGDAPRIGILVRTDSEVISASHLIKRLESSGDRYVVIQDEILSSTSTVARLNLLNIQYIPVGSGTGFLGFLKVFFTSKKLIMNDRAFVFDFIASISEQVLFRDESVAKELRKRLLDFWLPQQHLMNELNKMITDFNLNCIITFAYVDQWGWVVKSAGNGAGIPTIAIQNAAQDPEEYPRLCWADHYCVESIYLKERLVALGYPKNKISGTGLPHYSVGSIGPSINKCSLDSKRILIITQPIYQRYYGQLIDEIARFCSDANLELAIKYHPRQIGDEYKQHIQSASVICNVNVYKDEPLDELLKSSRLVVSVVSAAILRALNLGVPTVSFLPKSEKYLDLYYTDSANLFVVSNFEELRTLLERVATDYDDVISEFRYKLENYFSQHCHFETTQVPLDNVVKVVSCFTAGHK